jgi:hypothetical protein
MTFTVIRSRTVAGQLGSRDEMYRPHFSQDGDVWEFTSALIAAEPGKRHCCVVPSLGSSEHDPGCSAGQMVIARSSKAMRSRWRLGASVAMP